MTWCLGVVQAHLSKADHTIWTCPQGCRGGNLGGGNVRGLLPVVPFQHDPGRITSGEHFRHNTLSTIHVRQRALVQAKGGVDGITQALWLAMYPSG
jgi:hypothetical protein